METRWYNDFLTEELVKERDEILKQIANIPLYPINDESLSRVRTLIVRQAQLCKIIELLPIKANEFIKKNNLPYPKYQL